METKIPTIPGLDIVQFSAFADTVPHLVWISAADGKPVYFNKQWYDYSGLTEKESFGNLANAIHPDDVNRSIERWNKVRATGELFEIEYRIKNKEGEYRWFLVRAAPVKNSDGIVERWYGTATDIDEKKQYEKQIIETEERFRIMADFAPVLIWMSGSDSLYYYFNKRWLDYRGKSLEQEIGNGWTEGIHPEDRSRTLEIYSKAFENRQEFKMEYRLCKADGEYGWILDNGIPRYVHGEFVGYIGSCVDITHTKDAEKEIYLQAYHDQLTGLPNRKYYEGHFSEVLKRAKALRSKFAVMFLDIDRLKDINDSLGHDFGDAILVEIASRLKEAVRSEDLISRWGGDEFVIILPEIYGAAEATKVAERVLESVQPVMRVGSQSLHVTGSIGIALFPADGEDIHSLQKNADAALYRAKDSGRNRFEMYNPIMNARASEKLVIENDLREAIKTKKGFMLYYQPILDLKRNIISSAETLVRWQHPRLGLLSPAKFIPVAEEIGLMVPLGNWIVKQAVHHLEDMHGKGLTISITINLSARQLVEEDVAETLLAIIAQSSVNPGYIKWEITESLAMENIDRTKNILNKFKEQGMSVIVDDFGVGYSSLNYLRRLPVDTLKVDKSFMRHVLTDENDTSIVKAIVSMAKSLNLKVIAEGVDSDMQLNFLSSLGCDSAQGYFISRPLKKQELLEFVATYISPLRVK